MRTLILAIGLYSAIGSSIYLTHSSGTREVSRGSKSNNICPSASKNRVAQGSWILEKPKFCKKNQFCTKKKEFFLTKKRVFFYKKRVFFYKKKEFFLQKKRVFFLQKKLKNSFFYNKMSFFFQKKKS